MGRPLPTSQSRLSLVVISSPQSHVRGLQRYSLIVLHTSRTGRALRLSSAGWSSTRLRCSAPHHLPAPVPGIVAVRVHTARSPDAALGAPDGFRVYRVVEVRKGKLADLSLGRVALCQLWREVSSSFSGRRSASSRARLHADSGSWTPRQAGWRRYVYRKAAPVMGSDYTGGLDDADALIERRRERHGEQTRLPGYLCWRAPDLRRKEQEVTEPLPVVLVTPAEKGFGKECFLDKGFLQSRGSGGRTQSKARITFHDLHATPCCASRI